MCVYFGGDLCDFGGVGDGVWVGGDVCGFVWVCMFDCVYFGLE